MEAKEKDAVEITVLQRTISALDDVQVEDELRSLAFDKVFDLVAGRILGVATPAAAAPNTVTATSQSAPEQTDAQDGDWLSKIAQRLKVDHAIVEEIYGEKDGELLLHVSPSSLDSTKSGGTKEIALLLAAGRQAAGIEEWTSHADIREWADHMNRLDPSNFAGTMAEMDTFLKTAGSSRKREAQLRATGWEEASRTARRLVEGGEG